MALLSSSAVGSFVGENLFPLAFLLRNVDEVYCSATPFSLVSVAGYSCTAKTDQLTDWSSLGRGHPKREFCKIVLLWILLRALV